MSIDDVFAYFKNKSNNLSSLSISKEIIKKILERKYVDFVKKHASLKFRLNYLLYYFGKLPDISEVPFP